MAPRQQACQLLPRRTHGGSRARRASASVCGKPVYVSRALFCMALPAVGRAPAAAAGVWVPPPVRERRPVARIGSAQARHIARCLAVLVFTLGVMRRCRCCHADEIVNDPATDGIIRWYKNDATRAASKSGADEEEGVPDAEGPEENGFVVERFEDFTTELLPRLSKSTSFCSFVRQLNDTLSTTPPTRRFTPANLRTCARCLQHGTAFPRATPRRRLSATICFGGVRSCSALRPHASASRHSPTTMTAGASRCAGKPHLLIKIKRRQSAKRRAAREAREAAAKAATGQQDGGEPTGDSPMRAPPAGRRRMRARTSARPKASQQSPGTTGGPADTSGSLQESKIRQNAAAAWAAQSRDRFQTAMLRDALATLKAVSLRLRPQGKGDEASAEAVGLIEDFVQRQLPVR